MSKLKNSVWRLVGWGSLAALGGALSVAGCSKNGESNADLGGNGGEGGESAATGGAAAGGTPASCEAPTLGAGGAGGAGGAAGEEIEIAGSYDDGFEGEILFDATGAQMFGDRFHFSVVDNSNNFAIARNDEGNFYNPCLWSRFDWTTDGDDLYYCQTAFMAEDEQGAAETEPADAEDLEKGCGSFPWSQLTEN